MSDTYRQVDEQLGERSLWNVSDPEFAHWLVRQRIRHSDLYQTFMALNTSDTTQDHFVETVIEAALTYGFNAGVTYCQITTTTSLETNT